MQSSEIFKLKSKFTKDITKLTHILPSEFELPWLPEPCHVSKIVDSF